MKFKESVIHLVLRLRGGGQPEPEMSIAVGGLIKQSIVRDCGYQWLPNQTQNFSVQVLNTLHFQHVTGEKPPESRIDRNTYLQSNYPFFSIYEEPSGIFSNFSSVQSVGQIDGIEEPEIRPRIMEVLPKIRTHDVIGIDLNWICQVCTLANRGSEDRCKVCKSAKSICTPPPLSSSLDMIVESDFRETLKAAGIIEGERGEGVEGDVFWW